MMMMVEKEQPDWKPPKDKRKLDVLVDTDCREEAEALLKGSGDYRLPVKPTEGV